MAQDVLRVEGYREFMRACARADNETRKNVRETLRGVGEIVRSDAAVRFSPVSARTAAGFRSRVLQRGVFVGQSIRKTTGRHPEYGAKQMRRALLPAFAANRARVAVEFDRAMQEVCVHFRR